MVGRRWHCASGEKYPSFPRPGCAPWGQRTPSVEGFRRRIRCAEVYIYRCLRAWRPLAVGREWPVALDRWTLLVIPGGLACGGWSRGVASSKGLVWNMLQRQGDVGASCSKELVSLVCCCGSQDLTVGGGSCSAHATSMAQLSPALIHHERLCGWQHQRPAPGLCGHALHQVLLDGHRS